MSQRSSVRRRGLLAAFALALPVVSAPVPAAALTQVLHQKVVAPDGAANARFGSAVAVDGTTLVVGAPFTNGVEGAVYVFERSRDTWLHAATLTASDGAAGDRLGSAVAVEGDTIVAGAWGVSSGRGSAYTFARTGAAVRTETAKLTASDGATSDRLGFSVAVEGDTIVAGAYQADAGVGDEGSVYTFARTGAAARTQTAKLTASDGATGDRLGWSVAVEGDTIVAGAPHDGTPSDAFLGAVYTFARTGDAARTETAKLTASDGAASDRLGWSVALGGDTIVAGARDDDVGSNADQGSAYAFARTGGAARTEVEKLTDPEGAASDLLGLSVAVDGDVLVAGAPEDLVGTNVDQGSTSVFFAPAPVPGPVPDTTAPDTTGLKGPKKVVNGKVAKFKFGSTEPGSTFRCQVDKKRWKDCTAPYKVKTKKLKVGKHTVRVVAIDAAGNADPSPAKTAFRVKPR